MRTWPNNAIATLTKWFAFKNIGWAKISWALTLCSALQEHHLISSLWRSSTIIMPVLPKRKLMPKMLSDLPKVKAKSQTDSTFLTIPHPTLLKSETHSFELQVVNASLDMTAKQMTARYCCGQCDCVRNMDPLMAISLWWVIQVRSPAHSGGTEPRSSGPITHVAQMSHPRWLPRLGNYTRVITHM